MVSYAVWQYYSFPMSLRMVDELLTARGIDLTDETVRRWSVKFGLGVSPCASALPRWPEAINGTSMRWS